MTKFFLSLISVLVSIQSTFAITQEQLTNHGTVPGEILKKTDIGLTGILSLIQGILLKIALPIVIVGASIWIAYQLFTAEGDETKMKKARKSVAYSAIALVAIALSVAIVQIISQISL